MRVVISGGSGLIGRAVALSLVKDGHQVVVLSRRPQRVSGFPPAIETKRWDGRSAEMLIPQLERTDAFIHLAGESIAAGRWTEERKRAIRESRVVSTAALSHALQGVEHRPAVLLQASAVGYYGPHLVEEIDEDEPVGADFLASVCRDWEAASLEVESAGIRRAVVRTGVVLARDGGALPRMLLPFRLFAGGPVGSGAQWVPWIHLADEVRALRFLIDCEDARGPYNLTAPEAVTNRQMARAIGRTLRRPGFVPTPAFVLRAALGEMATLVLEGQRAVPRGLLDLGFEFRFPHLEPALRDLLARG
jgi:uncharacterized protein (TIGR01777 family)